MSNELVPSYARYTDENYVDKKVTWENLPDKPFYSEVKDVFIYETQETEVGYIGSSGAKPAIFTRLGFEIGKTYKVIWNSMEYTCTAFEASMEGATGIGVGNIAVAGGENTGEPFIIADVIGTEFGTVIDLTASSSGTATFGVITEKEVVTKIPEKFLPKQKENLSEFNNDLYGEQDELEVILNKDDVEFTYQSQYGLNSVVYINKNLIKEVAIYVVKIDGKKYRLESKLYSKDEYDTVHVLGNGALYEPVANKLGNTGEPFVIYSSSLDGNVIVFAGDENSTFELYKVIGTEIKKIPSEYVEMPYGEVYELEDAYSVNLSNLEPFNIDGYMVYTFFDGKFKITEENVEYLVNIDSIEYACKSICTYAEGDNPSYSIGNLSISDKSYPDTGEPFIIGYAPLDGLTIILPLDSTAKNISIKKIISTKINKIPSKYVEPCFGEFDSEYLVQDFVPTEENEGIMSTAIDFVEGHTYTIIYKETEYKCVAKKAIITALGGVEAVGVGNFYKFLGEGEDTGEPFAIGTANIGQVVTMALTNSDGPISIKGSTIKYIDPRFIDVEWMAIKETQKADLLLDTILFGCQVNESTGLNEARITITDYDPFKTGETFIIGFNDKEYKCDIIRSYNDEGQLSSFGFGNIGIKEGVLINDIPFLMIGNVIDPNLDGDYIFTSEDIEDGTPIKIWSAVEKVKEQLPPEFIKDMYYDGSKVLIPMCTLKPNDTHNSYFDGPGLGLELGQKYIVTYNGVRHELTSYIKEHSGTPYITLGDKIIHDFEITDYPVMDGVPYGAYNINTKQYTDAGWEPFTIEVVKEDIHQIDPKYIADMYHDDTKAIFPMSSLTFNDNYNTHVNTGTLLNLIVNDKYTVIFNGVTYNNLIAYKKDIGGVLLGGESFGCPFKIEDFSIIGPMFNVVYHESTGSENEFTLEIIKEDLHKIDNKFIDAEWMATKEVGEGDTIYSETFTTIGKIEADSVFKDTRYYTEFTGNVNWRDFEIGKKYIIKEINGTHTVEARPLYDSVSDGVDEIVGVIFGNSTLDPAIPEKCKLDTGDTFYVALSNDASYTNGYVSEKQNSGEFTVSFSECVDVYNKLPKEYLPESVDYFIMNSSTEGSTKQFKITIGDDGVLVASEL